MTGIFENREMFAAAAGIFLAASACGWVSAWRRDGNISSRRIGHFLEIFFSAAAWMLLTLALFGRGCASGRLPVSNIFEIFQTLGWFAAFSVVLLRAVWSLRVPAFFGTLVAGLLCALGFANAETWDFASATGTSLAGTPWLGVHAAFATVGYACFSAAAMVGSLYLLQNFALRKRRTHRFFSKLPDLASLDRIAGRLYAAGLVFFGAGAVFGASMLFGGPHVGSALVIYKTAFSAVLFAVVLVLVVLRRKNKISALKFARAGVAVFVAAIILLGGIACVAAATQSLPESVQTEVGR